MEARLSDSPLTTFYSLPLPITPVSTRQEPTPSSASPTSHMNLPTMALRDEHQTLLVPGRETTVLSRLSRLRDWTIPAVMLAQISFFVFAWTFAGVMMHKTIPLPDASATWIQNHPSDTQVIYTRLTLTMPPTQTETPRNSLLDRAVQNALVRCLSYAPLRLHTVMAWAKLAQHSVSLHFDRRGLPWTLLSVAWVALLGFLTTAWSTLLAPESVVIYYDFQGNETDFLDPSASNLFSRVTPQSQVQPGFNLTPADAKAYANQMYSFSDLTESLMDAGFWAASAKLHPNNPSAAGFISTPASWYVSNISTGGILAIGNLTSSTFPVHPNISSGVPLYQGLSRTYSTTQRGFTADVSCRTPMLNDPVTMLNIIDSLQISVADEDIGIILFGDSSATYTYTMDIYSWSTNCSSEVEYSTFGATLVSSDGDSTTGLLMTSVCFGQDFSGSSNQSFLVLLTSSLNSTYTTLNQICQVTPLVTTVQTTYDQTGIISITQPPLNQHLLPDPTGTDSENTGALLWLPAFTIWTTFVRSQGLTANMMGDKLLAFNQADYTPVTENYLRGMMEYLGSLMAQMVDYDAGPTVPFSITVHVRTIGWKFHPRTHGLSLTAITFVTGLTVVAGVFALKSVNPSDGASKSQTQEPRVVQTHVFNPTDTMDVLLASSTGDLARVLSESCDAYRHAHMSGKYGDGVEERLTVVLGMSDEGWPVLRTVNMNVTDADADMHRRGSSARRDRVFSGLGKGDDDGSSADVSRWDEEMELGEMRVGLGQGNRIAAEPGPGSSEHQTGDAS